MGGTKQPYDPRIHFVLIRDAYLDANPGNEKVRRLPRRRAGQVRRGLWRFERPGFLEGYKALKEAITPWGA